MLEKSYMSVADYPDLSYEKLLESKHKYVEETKGVLIDYSHHVIVPILPTEWTINYFNCDAYQPILKILNTTYLSSGEILDYVELYIITHTKITNLFM